jgi:PTH1 family peptidyl-tRNA hydrolase
MFFSRKPAGPVSWLIVGLGNMGDQYEHTRHNVGFDVIDQLADGLDIPVQRLKFKALTNTASLGGQTVLLMKPVTYMNLSGEAVAPAASFYKIPPEHILVISDEVSLPPGKLRIRQSGSAGGHNGLKNIISHLHSDQFPRIRLGVGGKPHPDYDMADWVLGKPQGEDRKAVDDAVKRAAQAVECYIKEGPQAAMSKFN